LKGKKRRKRTIGPIITSPPWIDQVFTTWGKKKKMRRKRKEGKGEEVLDPYPHSYYLE